MAILLFVFGVAVGSFLNVVSLRYRDDKFLLSQGVIGGRSRCPHCKTALGWFELIPLLSFLLQRGRCRSCGAKISFQYPLVEFLSGLIFVFVPSRLVSQGLVISSASHLLLSTFWVLVFLTLLLISLIDLRLGIIPDEANVFLLFLGFLIILFTPPYFASGQGSFFGPYSPFFGSWGSIWPRHILAALLMGAFFGFLIYFTRGRGMGVGDLKLGIPLGFIFGWPDIVLIICASFIIGSLAGLYVIAFKNKSLKSSLPFGPFLAAAAAITFFFGYELINLYFRTFYL
jgi:prepilin signal peptidase PulO-like enzyme (type II secretory pathway)